MNHQDLRTYEMLLRVRDFGAVEAAAFPPATVGGQLFTEVATSTSELGVHVAAQLAGSNAMSEGSVTKASSRAALKRALQRIRRTTRALAEDIPGFDEQFRIPETATDQELIGVANVFATAALPAKAQLISYGLPANFLEELNSLKTAFESAVRRLNTGKGERVTATAAIEDAVERGLSARRKLDAVVRNTFHDQPAKLAAWESARHIERAAKRKSQGTTAPAPANNPSAT